ncbi:hypothetical protein N7931_19065 [Catenovulum sp. 2E275]|uniref:hypothetical protein n=1 Tax=Catenovulum sp. 2E275 TaxID=2980497 RepID=UPI0021D0A6A3|nr:hypothetical protein [Catenovulum sp. 2E275]MCU4677713.1 hypothetical protein [Catenovulum sp. 2E275]
MGLLLFKGMKVGIQDGDLSTNFDENGISGANLNLSTSYNMLPIWLKIAYDNLILTKKANIKISEQWNEKDVNKQSLLLDELSTSIQVFVACGSALDALYDQLKEFANISQADIDLWKSKRTPRSAQIVEIIRRVYKLDKNFVKGAKRNIKSIMEFRDKVVHSSHEIRQVCTRPDISESVDWRFSAYKYTNSMIAYQRTMELLVLLYDKKAENAKVNENMEYIVESLIELGLVQKNA